MKPQINGQIITQGFKPTKPILSFLKKRVEKWIADKKSTQSDDLYYFLKVGRFNRRDRFECFLYLRNEKEMERGFDMGKNIQDAIDNTLKHLRPIS